MSSKEHTKPTAENNARIANSIPTMVTNIPALQPINFNTISRMSAYTNPHAVTAKETALLKVTAFDTSFFEGFILKGNAKNVTQLMKRKIHFNALKVSLLNSANFSKISILISPYLSDFAALHFLHSICRLLSVVCPPLLQGMMWSPSISAKAYSVLMPFATHKGHFCPCRS